MNKNNLFLKICVAVGYVAMLTVNYLANALPIGLLVRPLVLMLIFLPLLVLLSLFGVLFIYFC